MHQQYDGQKYMPQLTLHIWVKLPEKTKLTVNFIQNGGGSKILDQFFLYILKIYHKKKYTVGIILNVA